MPKPLLLVDADSYIYRAASACETVYVWDDMHTLASDAREVLGIVRADFASLRDRFDAELRLCLTNRTNWRQKIHADYKENRRFIRKPLGVRPVRIALQLDQAAFGVAESEGLEADDLMGIYSTEPRAEQREVIIVSIDKDMRGVPGLLYNPNVDPNPIAISVEEADLWHATQALVGDTADGYKGCPGFGPVSAAKWLANVKPTPAALWTAVKAAFAKANLTDAEAEKQMTLSRILRFGEWDFRKQALLWRPGM